MQINKYININKLNNSLKNFNKGRPFPYVVIDNFLKIDFIVYKKLFDN